MTKQVDSAEEFDGLINGSQLVVVDFYAAWCGPCKQLAPILEEIEGESSGATIVKVDVEKSGTLAQKYSVSSIPTVIFFKGGQEVEKFVGLRSKEDIVALIDKHK